MAHLLYGHDAGRGLARTHLVLLPERLPADVVVGLVRARHPEVAPSGDGTWRVGRWTSVSGPLLLDAAAAAAAAVPDPWRCAWSLTCPVERDDDAPHGPDRDGLHRAFPDGLPVRAEARAVDLALALARRLDGAVRVAGSGALLRPDPDAWLRRTVLSPYWLDPDQALDVARAAEPAAELATAGAAWEGLRPEAVAALEAARAVPAATDREALHLAAEERDARATAAPDELDAYALAVHLGEPVADGRGGWCGADGVVQVEVGAVEGDPGALAGLAWATHAVSYGVTWWPADPSALEAEHPGPDVRAARERAARVVARLASGLARTVGGLVLDADGLPVV